MPMSDEEAIRAAKQLMERQRLRATSRDPNDTQRLEPVRVEHRVVMVKEAVPLRWTTHTLSTQSLILGCASLVVGCLPPVPIWAMAAALIVLHQSEVKTERNTAWGGLVTASLSLCAWGAMVTLYSYGTFRR